MNEGFGRNRNEIFQGLTRHPKSYQDEEDSGLYVDASKIVAKAENHYEEKAVIIIMIQNFAFDEADFVHVMSHGRIAKSGDHLLAKEIESKGYGWVNEG